MSKVNDTAENIRVSIGGIYKDFLSKKESEKESKKETKRAEKEEAKEKKKEDKEEEQIEKDRQKAKQEKLESDINTWQSIITDLRGEDLEFVPKKKGKKKYRQWIGEDDDDGNVIKTIKPVKKKKRDYKKDFQPELDMLRKILTDQNQFIADLQRRYRSAAGPATKDMAPLTKNLIELITTLNNARGNSLGLLREISSVKKTIADLYNKQKEFEKKYGSGAIYDNSDLGLMGSDLASSLFGPYTPTGDSGNFTHSYPIPGSVTTPDISSHNISSNPYPSMNGMQSFDPESWDGGGLDAAGVYGESIPHSIVVEWHKTEDKARFKALRNDNGEELYGVPGLPTCKVTKIDEENKVAKDEFDQVYKLEIIE